jgi:type I restriction enzyme S subunit
MTWKSIPLGELVTLQRGYDLPDQDREVGYVPIYGSAGITGYHNVAKAKAPGVLVGRSGASFGVVNYAPIDYWPHNAVMFVTDFHGNNERFVYYLLKNIDFSNYNSGSAQPSLNRNFIYPIPVKVPSLSTQHRIADILSAYDDLIENNTRRIRILEQMAQAIYQEWFGKFDKASLPDGWEAAKVEEVITRLQTGKRYDIKTVYPEGAVPVLDQGKSGVIGYHNEEPGVLASEENPIIVFANHTCYQKIIQFPFSTIQNVIPFVPKDKTRNIYWLHYATKDLIRFNDYKGHWPEYMSKYVILPPKELSDEFGKIAKPIIQLLFSLERKTANLRQTRDLLLPRLVSGGIELK